MSQPDSEHHRKTRKEATMLERIEDYFLEQPSRLISLGRFLFILGAGLIVAGLFGRLATTVPSIFSSMGGVQGAAKALADVYPTLPTWWVPESLVGCVPALILIGLGLWLVATGRRFLRFLGR